MSETFKPTATNTYELSSSSSIPHSEPERYHEKPNKKGRRAIKFIRNILGLKKKDIQGNVKAKTSEKEITESGTSSNVNITYSYRPANQDDHYFPIVSNNEDQASPRTALRLRHQLNKIIQQDDFRSNNSSPISTGDQLLFPNANDNDDPVTPKKVLRTRNQWREFIAQHDKFDFTLNMRNIDPRFYSLPPKSKVKGDILYQRASYLRKPTPSNTSCSFTGKSSSSCNDHTENDFENDSESHENEGIGEDEIDSNVVQEVLENMVDKIEKSCTAPSGRFGSKRFGTELFFHVIN